MDAKKERFKVRKRWGELAAKARKYKPCGLTVSKYWTCGLTVLKYWEKKRSLFFFGGGLSDS
jgi:hypothetical protein